MSKPIIVLLVPAFFIASFHTKADQNRSDGNKKVIQASQKSPDNGNNDGEERKDKKSGDQPVENSQVDKSKEIKVEDMMRIGIDQLLEIQDEEGSWAYEGVYRVGRNRVIPIGYRIGGTALVGEALLSCGKPGDKRIDKAIEKGVSYILTALEHETMKPSKENRYDVRIWGHAYALTFFCHLKKANRIPAQHKAKVLEWMETLVGTIIYEELDGGGWNYQGRRRHAAFVTASAAQSLMYAREHGYSVPDDVFERTRKILKKSRSESGAYVYAGLDKGGDNFMDKLPGSIARAAICESTLKLLGDGSDKHITDSLDAFFEHWKHLEARRKKTGTHKPPYGIAPYYFYYGHRYAGQAIQLLPKDKQEKYRKQMVAVIQKTRDDDGTWNDRVFPQSRKYSTAMAILSLDNDSPVPRPVKADKETKKTDDGKSS